MMYAELLAKCLVKGGHSINVSSPLDSLSPQPNHIISEQITNESVLMWVVCLSGLGDIYVEDQLKTLPEVKTYTCTKIYI